MISEYLILISIFTAPKPHFFPLYLFSFFSFSLNGVYFLNFSQYLFSIFVQYDDFVFLSDFPPSLFLFSSLHFFTLSVKISLFCTNHLLHFVDNRVFSF